MRPSELFYRTPSRFYGRYRGTRRGLASMAGSSSRTSGREPNRGHPARRTARLWLWLVVAAIVGLGVYVIGEAGDRTGPRGSRTATYEQAR
jgi:hypothetical protein